MTLTPISCGCSKLRRASRVIAGIYDRALAGTGLTIVQFGVLRTLRRLGPTALTPLGEAMGYDRTTLTRLLRPLEAAGWTESRGCDDRRARIVAVTAAGEGAIARAEPAWSAAQDLLARQMGDDWPALFALLDRVEELRA